MSAAGAAAGSITAAQFIQRFVNNKPWAHLDIAGVAWSSKDTACVPKGATAYGVSSSIAGSKADAQSLPVCLLL